MQTSKNNSISGKSVAGGGSIVAVSPLISRIEEQCSKIERWCKTWTLDSGLHFGLDFGLDIGLDFVRMAQKACQRSLYLCLSGCLWELKWGRRGVATLRSAGGGWGSILLLGQISGIC